MTYLPARVCIFLALSCIGTVRAQSSAFPDPTPEIRRQELRQEQLRREQESMPSVRLSAQAPPTAQPLPHEETCRKINEVVFEGLPALDAQLAASLAGVGRDDSPLGRCVGVQGIAVLADRARNTLIANGYITSRIEAPAQDLSTGRLLLNVIVGRVAVIDKGTGAAWVRHTAPLFTNEALNLRDIEQSLENLRRNPSVQADLQLRPGEQIDTSDVVLDYNRQRPLRGYFSLDDSGSSATGKLMAQATLSWDSPLGLSDLAYLSTSRDVAHRQDGPRGNDSQTLHYSVPWGYWLMGATLSRSNYRQTIAGAFQSYLYSGQTQSRELQLGRVIHRDANSKTSVQVKGFSRQSNNFIDDTEVEVQKRSTAGWEASVLHARYWGQVNGDLQLSYKRGTGAWGAMAAPEELFGEGSSRMQVGTAVANLQWPVADGNRLTAVHYLKLQVNRTPLVPQDRMCLGGRYTVRGFDGRQNLCGDRGLLLRNDLIHALNGPTSAYIGLDYGRVGGRSAQDLPERSMSGYVLGLRGQHRLDHGAQIQFEAFVGRHMAKPTFIPNASTNTGMSLSLSF
ncbi:ShlB/FhaC/HecB family hemolysin secretion/activation protein [Limnohabitans sp. Rim8]|uniref:ShlB/FhaC/HecB family hemolysin secretion/activation protein n=1 Tax=Limnohabitans sp. Rim8 TaxID=1100718 RepID=UPI003305AE31